MKCSKSNTNISSYEVDKDVHMEFEKTALSIKSPSKSIFLPINELSNECNSSNLNVGNPVSSMLFNQGN